MDNLTTVKELLRKSAATVGMPAASVPIPFVGSDVVLKRVFDALNRNYFNNRLSGIELKWLTDLKSRTAASVHGKTSNFNAQTFICLSKTLLQKCTRKQVVESLLYEMLLVYINSKLSDAKSKESDVERANQVQMLLQKAMDYLNQKTGMSLSFNYPLRAHQTVDSYSEWIDVEDDVNFHKFNDTIVCISDDDTDDEEERFEEIRKKGYASVEQICAKIDIRDISDTSFHTIVGIACICCTNYNDLFKKLFAGTNFHLISGETPLKPAQRCPVCLQTVENGKLNDHLASTCAVLPH